MMVNFEVTYKSLHKIETSYVYHNINEYLASDKSDISNHWSKTGLQEIVLEKLYSQLGKN